MGHGGKRMNRIKFPVELKKSILAIVILAVFVSNGFPAGVMKKFKQVKPEELGWSAEKLNEAKAFAMKINSAAVMVLVDGKILIAWGDVKKKYSVHSIRKPFLNSLFGVYLERAKINLDAAMEDLKIDDIPPSLTDEEKKATVRDLLKSRSGIYHEAAAEAQVMKDTRPVRGSHLPNTFFYYNNWDFNALGAIFEKVTGKKIFEAFKKEIADPIGMEDFSLKDCAYSYEKELSLHPAYNFRMSARDMARFGMLYLRNGVWGKKRIIPQSWIEESTKAYSVISEEMGIGYGYLWNIVKENSRAANMLFDGKAGYYHTGVGIHTLAVIPELKIVYVYRYDTDGKYVDPGNATIQLVDMIMKARIKK